MFFNDEDMTVGSDVAQTEDVAAETPAEEATEMPVEATEEAPASEEAAM